MRVKWGVRSTYLLQGNKVIEFLGRSVPFLQEDYDKDKEENIVSLDQLSFLLTKSIFTKECASVTCNENGELQIELNLYNDKKFIITNDNLKEYKIVHYFAEDEKKSNSKRP